ncbi:kinase-like domain-containing protein [Sphaerosporella brunnea]|uniref:Kinase-like domain-containing protein n=1 Tax=Sphaerosporella brunnea TaxID=1250544 RepID=A0A5J5F4S4_9PEZI|nr:kinase-like domain-containing protein [Sphaerosporella brunnea]
MEAQRIIQDFNDRTRDYWQTGSEYEKVTALLLYWEEDDLNVVPEVDKLRTLFEQEFNFSTATVILPSISPRAELQYELAAFVKKHGLAPRSLIIVYYAGHADPPDAKNPSSLGHSHWRAKEAGGPTLDWFELQPTLYAAQSDILILLDCCHAALKTRGGKDSKMEILAASASGSCTPAPGRLSFTSVLIRQVRKRLKLGPNAEFTIRWLHKHLFDDKIDFLLETPVYFDLSNEDQSSIVLKPLLLAPPSGFARKAIPPSSFMLLKVSLVDDPTGLQIANWLKSFSPKNIRAVDIEGLVLKARRLEGLKEHQTLFPGSLLGSLSESAQREVAERLRDLSDVVSSTASTAAAQAKKTTASVRSAAVFSDPKSAERALNNLEATVSDLCASVESNLLLDPNVDLKAAAHDEVAIAVGAGDAISLRQYLLDRNLIPEKPELPNEAITFTDLNSEDSVRFRYAEVAGTPVIVESFEYGFMVSSDDEGPPPGTAKQFKTMVTQLSQPKRTSFHILPCVGYIHESSAQRFGLVFELSPGQATGHKTLFDSFSAAKRVPLGHRIQLSYALAVAIENLHRVGWVHKELRSQNIVFFAHEEPGQDQTKPRAEAYLPELAIDVGKPYLFGFEYSRPDDAETALMPDFSTETNVYRHPERWGKPGVRFTKPHDIYALGVILFELARWQTAISFAGSHSRMDPWKLKEKFLAEAKKNFPHRVGQVFSDVIVACLSFEESTRGFNELDMHKVFQTDVLERLHKAVGNI